MKSNWKSETHVVLDACALIAFLNDESGAEVVTCPQIGKETKSLKVKGLKVDETQTFGLFFIIADAQRMTRA